ncbi:MAG: tannase/feruloyl esterase family alpha/beta hydrolase [Vulcanimicrobiaceae bacterium]
MNRLHFLASASALAALGGCADGGSTPAAPINAPFPAPPLPAGATVADLRFGFSPTPAPFPGYDPAGDAKALILAGTPSPAATPVPGTLATGSYAANQRYVIKVPQKWNGKLVVAGTPAFRSEFANDAIWGDFALANGYAFASSNKGLQYNAIFEALSASPDLTREFPVPFDFAGLETKKFGFRFGALAQTTSIAAWNADLATLTAATQNFLKTYFGALPTRTYAVGLSNGGAQVRSLLERYGDLVDGGVDWSGVFWSQQSNILTYMPKMLANMPAYVASKFTDPAAAAAIVAAGYPADIVQGAAANPSLWFEYYANQPSFYTDLTVFAYGLLLDSTATSSVTLNGCKPDATNPTGLPGTCDATGLAVPRNRATYAPPPGVATNVATFEHTGTIRKPLVSIAGSADMFITPANNAKAYLDRVVAAGNGGKYWQYIVNGGTHVDTFAKLGYGLQPQLPFAWAAFNQVVAVVERGFAPPGAGSQQAVATPDQIRAT